MENDADLTFGEAWYALRNWEIATINNRSLPEEEKNLALLTASGLRNMLKFEYENGQISEDRGNGCFLGRKLSCWGVVMTKALFDSLKAALTVLEIGQSPDWTKLKKAAFKIGSIALVIEVIKLYMDEKCKCDAVDGEGPVACAIPNGISMLIGDCNTTEQVFTTFGYGSSPGTFSWVIENGYFPDFSSNGNFAMTATTISPSIKVHQNNPNVPVKLTVAASCNGVFMPALDYSIPNLVNDPGTLWIFGANEVNAGPYIEKYEFWGSWLTSQNSVITYSGCTPHGEVQEQGVDFIKIKWTSATPTYPTPTVTAIVKNICSNLSLTKNLYVIVH